MVVVSTILVFVPPCSVCRIYQYEIVLLANKEAFLSPAFFVLLPGLVSMFLHLHPDGASLDYLWSYVHTREPTLQPCDVEVLLSKFPALFPLEVTGVGATLERRWKFGGFAPSL